MKFISVAKDDGPAIWEGYAAREIAQSKVPLSIFFYRNPRQKNATKSLFINLNQRFFEVLFDPNGME